MRRRQIERKEAWRKKERRRWKQRTNRRIGEKGEKFRMKDEIRKRKRVQEQMRRVLERK